MTPVWFPEHPLQDQLHTVHLQPPWLRHLIHVHLHHTRKKRFILKKLKNHEFRKQNVIFLTPRCSPSLILSVCISLRVFLLKFCIMALCAVRRVEAFRSCTATTDITGLQIRNWMSAPTDTRPPSLVVTFWQKNCGNVLVYKDEFLKGTVISSHLAWWDIKGSGPQVNFLPLINQGQNQNHSWTFRRTDPTQTKNNYPLIVWYNLKNNTVHLISD